MLILKWVTFWTNGVQKRRIHVMLPNTYIFKDAKWARLVGGRQTDANRGLQLSKVIYNTNIVFSISILSPAFEVPFFGAGIRNCLMYSRKMDNTFTFELENIPHLTLDRSNLKWKAYFQQTMRTDSPDTIYLFIWITLTKTYVVATFLHQSETIVRRLCTSHQTSLVDLGFDVGVD